MNRRDVLRSLVGVAAVGSAAVVESSAEPSQPSGAATLSPDAVAELMRAHGLEPLPGEPAQVRMLLLSTRSRTLPDPRIEPAIRLDPGTD